MEEQQGAVSDSDLSCRSSRVEIKLCPGVSQAEEGERPIPHYFSTIDPKCGFGRSFSAFVLTYRHQWLAVQHFVLKSFLCCLRTEHRCSWTSQTGCQITVLRGGDTSQRYLQREFLCFVKKVPTCLLPSEKKNGTHGLPEICSCV